MSSHDPYLVSALEYLVAVAFLGCFVVFWRYVNGESALLPVGVGECAAQLAALFRVPDRVWLHAGHGWARPVASDVVTVGVDDFAQQLVGSISEIGLPEVGASIQAGAPAWTLGADAKRIDMLAPVTGTVIAVNDALKERPDLVNDDPYGGGWLARVRVPRASRAVRALLSGRAARDWMDAVAADLTAALAPELGALSQDGGTSLHGFARAIDPAHWDEVARRFLRS